MITVEKKKEQDTEQGAGDAGKVFVQNGAKTLPLQTVLLFNVTF